MGNSQSAVSEFTTISSTTATLHCSKIMATTLSSDDIMTCWNSHGMQHCRTRRVDCGWNYVGTMTPQSWGGIWTLAAISRELNQKQIWDFITLFCRCSVHSSFRLFIHGTNEFYSYENSFMLHSGEAVELMVKPKLIITDENLRGYSVERWAIQRDWSRVA